MSSNDYQMQDIYKYSRKSYKKNHDKSMQDSNVCSPREININEAKTSPRSARSDGCTPDYPGCSCDLDPDALITNILHRKCPVITLAQQQLQKLLNETDKLLCNNTRCCRSLYDFLFICKEALQNDSKFRCLLLVLFIVASFFLGLLAGAASCGSYLGRFNSPILYCIDNYFIPDTYPSIEQTLRSIV